MSLEATGLLRRWRAMLPHFPYEHPGCQTGTKHNHLIIHKLNHLSAGVPNVKLQSRAHYYGPFAVVPGNWPLTKPANYSQPNNIQTGTAPGTRLQSFTASQSSPPARRFARTYTPWAFAKRIPALDFHASLVSLAGPSQPTNPPSKNGNNLLDTSTVLG